MNEFELNEYNTYITYFNFKKSLLENNIEMNNLDSTKIAELQAIADLPLPSFPRSMAQGVLCFFYDICYPEDARVLPPENSNRMIAPLKSNEPSKEIIAYPNPAKEYVAFYFNMKDKNEVQDLIVADIMGKPVYRQSLKGYQGQHIWDTKK